MGVNQVLVNGTEIMSTRSDTVSQQNLVEGETATNNQGEKIVGQLDPVSHEEAYVIQDPQGDIDDNDYIPFHDVSDAEIPKKKTLFSAIVNKLKEVFATVTGNNIEDRDTFRRNIHTLEWLGTDIPDNSDLDDYKTAGNYRVVSDASGATIAHLPLALCGKVIVFDNGNTGIEQFYLPNHAPRIFVRTIFGSEAWSDWKEVSEPHTYELGTEIPANADLNTYTTEGVYQCELTTTARTMSNLPFSGDDRIAFKLIVSKLRNSSNLYQLYVPYSIGNYAWNKMAWRTTNNNGSTWQSWMIFSHTNDSYNIQSGVFTASIPANADLNNYTTAGTYDCGSGSTVETLSNCPITKAFKMQVDLENNPAILTQTITIIHDKNAMPWRRSKNSSNEWGTWKQFASTTDITPATIGNGYAEATVSGSAITATITGFQLKTGAIVAIKINADVISACTLNINNTGAKYISFWNNESPSYGKLLRNGAIYTFIYDGTYYRVISFDRSVYSIPSSYVADTSGYLFAEWGYNVNRAQIAYNLSKDKMVWNRYKNSTWKGLCTLADYDDLAIIHNVLGAKNLFNWDLHTDIFNNNNDSSHSGVASHTISDAIITVTASATSDTYHKGIYLSSTKTNQMLADFNGLSITLSCDVKTNTAITNGFRFGFDNDSSYYSVGTDYTHIEKTLTLNTSLTNNNLIFYIPTVSAYTFYIKNIMIRPAIIANQTYENFSMTNQQLSRKESCFVGTCETAAATKDKVAYVDGYFVLRKGVRVAIKYSNTNTYSSSTSNPITLNVNNTGAKYIWMWNTHSGAGNTGTITDAYGSANRYNYYVYDGTYWVFDGKSGDSNNTNYYPLTGGIGTGATRIRNNTIDASKANNNVSASTYVPMVDALDKSDRILGRLETNAETDGNIIGYWYVRNYDTNGDIKDQKGIRLYANKEGGLIARLEDGCLELQRSTTTAADSPVYISARIKDTTTNKEYYNYILMAYQDHNSEPYGHNVLLGGGGATIIGSGEGAQNHYNVLTKPFVNEYLFLTSDGNIYLQTNAQTIANRQGFLLNASGELVPCKAEVATNNFGSIGNSSYKVANVYTTKINNVNVGNFSWYGTCTTAAGTKDKEVTLSNYTLTVGSIVGVKFSNTNTYSATADNKVTLNVNSTGAKPIYYGQGYPTGVHTTAFGIADRVHYYMYDGTNWVWLSHGADNDGNNRKAFYGTCATAATERKKVASLSDTSGWELRAGTIVGVKFTNTNSFLSGTATPITLNVNNTGDKNIWYANTHSGAGNTGSNTTAYGRANYINYYMYDGTYWVWLSSSADNNTDVRPSAYCETAAGTAAKTASCTNYKLLSKSHILVLVVNANSSASALTLNINGQGAKPIYINGSASSASNYTLPAGSYLVYYNGTNYYFRTDGKITCAGTVTV